MTIKKIPHIMPNRRPLALLLALVLMTIMAATTSAQTANNYLVQFSGRTYVEATNQTTFVYVVSGTGIDPALSYFSVQIPVCQIALELVSYSPLEAVSFGTDPTTEISGIKWDLPLATNATRTYAITFAGEILLGEVQVAVKGGPGFETLSLPGPSCSAPDISIEKYVSVDGGSTYQDADSTPGIDAELDSSALFRFVITNSGTTLLTDFVLTDDQYDLGACNLPDELEAGAFFECTIGPFPIEAGQHQNTATVSAVYEDITVMSSDPAYYWGGDRPELSVFKFVSVDDGSTWVDANTSPGPQVNPGDDVHFRFVITNSGNVQLTELAYVDDMLDLSTCDQTETLNPDETLECVIGPLPADEGQHSNTLTASASISGSANLVSASDQAHYFGGETDDEEFEVTIVIVGPVEFIDGNIIVIYGNEIVLDPESPLLLVIEIGDVIRIEGDLADDINTLVIIAVTVVIVDVDVFVNDEGNVWRDDSNCGNAPPPWAPAHGWRRRCDPSYQDRS